MKKLIRNNKYLNNGKKAASKANRELQVQYLLLSIN